VEAGERKSQKASPKTKARASRAKPALSSLPLPAGFFFPRRRRGGPFRAWADAGGFLAFLADLALGVVGMIRDRCRIVHQKMRFCPCLHLPDPEKVVYDFFLTKIRLPKSATLTRPNCGSLFAPPRLLKTTGNLKKFPWLKNYASVLFI
jgi:hypothetical protein